MATRYAGFLLITLLLALGAYNPLPPAIASDEAIRIDADNMRLPALIEHRAGGDPQRAAELAQQAKPLLFPDELGERFKVLGLGRGIDRIPSGFRFADHLARLSV